MLTHYSPDNAPAESTEIMKGVEQKMGFIPNLYGYLAASPQATKAYSQLTQLLGESSLTPQQVQIALLTTSVENQCRFCVAAHSAGGTMAKVDPATIDAIRAGQTPQDANDAALVTFVRAVVKQRGWVGEDGLKRFLDAGFDQAQVLDTLTAVALKTQSNYVNHISNPPLNPELEKFAWEPKG